MPEYSFQHIEPLRQDTLQSGAYIWIWHANKIPPHLGISVDGRYFSLKYNGKDVDLDVRKTLNILCKKQIPSLFVRLEKTILPEKLNAVFQQFDKATSEGETCLRPILEVLDMEGKETIFELLNLLRERRECDLVYGINLPTGYNGIPLYGKEEIRLRLIQLEHASNGKYLSKIG